MLCSPPPTRLSFVLAVLAAPALTLVGVLLWCALVRPPAVDAGHLADLEVCPGSEIVVTGEWDLAWPSEMGFMLVVLRGQGGGRVLCHFEDVPPANRSELETRLARAGEVIVRGRWDGVEDGVATLRGCSLLD